MLSRFCSWRGCKAIIPISQRYCNAHTATACAARQGQEELLALYDWFMWYDVQVMQYQRCLRLGVDFDQDVAALELPSGADN